MSGHGETGSAANDTMTNEPLSSTASVNGTLRVGRTFIVVDNPRGGGMPAVCVIPDDERLTVFISVRRVVGRVAVTREQQIELSFAHIPPVRAFAVDVSADRLQVSVHATVRVGVRRRLEEAGPAHEVELRIVDEEWPAEEGSAATIHKLLTERGFQGELDEQAVASLCAATCDTSRSVLRGRIPKAGHAERFLPCGLPENWVSEESEAPWVAQGALVAQLEGAVSPVPGRDVTGLELLTFEDGGRQSLGRGVRQTGDTVVAARAGRVLFTRARIDVIPELVLEGDLTEREGQVIFDGDVLVRGSLQEGASIKASGNVNIHGDALEATVEAGRGVSVTGAVLRANIHGGLAQSVHQRMYGQVVQLNDDWMRFQEDYGLLIKQAMLRADIQDKLHLLADMLLVRRHSHLDDLFVACASWEDSYYLRYDAQIAELTEQIRQKWRRDVRQSLVWEDIEKLAELLQTVKEHLRLLLTEPLSAVSVHSVSSSQVDATGDIVVHGVGVFSSHLESGRDIVADGVVRGGFLLADRAVRIGELGSPAGVESSVRVKRADGIVHIGVRHGNTLIDLAGKRSRNTNTEQGVRWGEYVHDVQRVPGGRCAGDLGNTPSAI